jgi:hypothetical protein
MAKPRRSSRSAAYRPKKGVSRPAEARTSATRPEPAAKPDVAARDESFSARRFPTRPRAAASAPAAAVPAKAPDFASEYHYVLSDLKHLGILAGGAFVVLAVLALLIH